MTQPKTASQYFNIVVNVKCKNAGLCLRRVTRPFKVISAACGHHTSCCVRFTLFLLRQGSDVIAACTLGDTLLQEISIKQVSLHCGDMSRQRRMEIDLSQVIRLVSVFVWIKRALSFVYLRRGWLTGVKGGT